MKPQFFKTILPWIVTGVALYYAFNDLNWGDFFSHLYSVDPLLLFLAVLAMCIGYPLRAVRWPYLLPHPKLTYLDSLRVLMLGFFMNNILPARAGEFVRAHVGAKIIGERRTRVLASVFSERLADGVTISLLFALFGLQLGDQELSRNFTYVAIGFGGIGVGVIILIALREYVFKIVEKLSEKFQGKASQFALMRAHTFVDGLAPLCSRKSMLGVIGLSTTIWLLELSVFVLISKAYGASLTFPQCVLLMVAVNFSGLIPAAPGGLGVIEAVASAVLISLGVGRELALTIVVTQHIMQYLVVGIPGAFILLNLKKYTSSLNESEDEQDDSSANSVVSS